MTKCGGRSGCGLVTTNKQTNALHLGIGVPNAGAGARRAGWKQEWQCSVPIVGEPVGVELYVFALPMRRTWMLT